MVLADLARGGIGKMRVHLANEFVRQGISVDFVLGRTDSPYIKLIGPGIRVIDIRSSHSLFSVPWLARYLHRERPDVVLTQRPRVNAATLRARALCGAQMPVWSSFNTNQTAQLASLRPDKRRKHLALMRNWYPRNDGLIAISHGVADDAAQVCGLPRDSLHVIYNPVVTPEIFTLADEPLDHPWFREDAPPVILGVGRLDPQKDFPILLRAFKRVRAQRDCRLVILGEGKLRDELAALARDLGIAEDVALPGFVDNPYAWMRRAAVFALSSAWEGSGNALTEAMALGTPVVSTECPDGPREVLDGGRYGPLVAVGDADALAGAILRTLAEPMPKAELQRGGDRYRLETSARRYLEVLGLAGEVQP